MTSVRTPWTPWRPSSRAGVGLGALLLLLTVAVAPVLAGCGGNSESAGNGTGTGTGNGGNGARAASQAAAETAARGVEFLLGLYDADGRASWGPENSGQFHVGINAVVLNGLLRAPQPVLPSADERVKTTLNGLIETVNENPYGLIWSGPQQGTAVYETATALRALVEAARLDPAWRAEANADAAIRKARGYLLSAQIDEVQEAGFDGDFIVNSPEDETYGPFYGGWGYGQIRREGKAPANMSTTNLAMAALDASFEVVEGDAEERAAYEASKQKLQNYLRHVHNLREYPGPGGRTVAWNATPIRQTHEATVEGPIMPGNDGGAGYNPGDSKAGHVELEGGMRSPRSYGSMTYALLRLYVMSGLSNDDPRVLKAFDWIRQAENYTFAHNPGFPTDNNQHYQGHFYYLYTAADTLSRLAPDGTVEDSKGEVHNWRADITRQLQRMQQSSGAWTNDIQRWEEADPRVATAWALIALGYSVEPSSRN